MRRTRLAPIAAAAVALLALSACGGGGGKSKGISPTDALDHPLTSSITFWHGYTDVEAKALQTLVDQWNAAHPSGKVNAVFDGGNDSALQKTTAAFVAGNYPDAAYEYGSSTNNLAKQPKLVDLTSLVKNTPRVTGFLGGDKAKPVPITESEAQRILNQVQEGVERPKPSITFEIGEQVRVSDGPFASFNGFVQEVDEEPARLKVEVSIFGRAVPVDLEFGQVEKG